MADRPNILFSIPAAHRLSGQRQARLLSAWREFREPWVPDLRVWSGKARDLCTSRGPTGRSVAGVPLDSAPAIGAVCQTLLHHDKYPEDGHDQQSE